MSDPKNETNDASEHEDARNQPNEDYESMPGTFEDTPHNMPGDQPEDDTPPPLSVAKGDMDKNDVD